MYLRHQAERYTGVPLEAFNEETLEFEPFDLTARLSLVDRFLSNFNRPLRRRMLHHPPGAEMPGSSTIRVPASGEVYLLGQERDDVNKRGAYHALTVCHLVTDEDGVDGSSGLAKIHRRVPKGPPEDPGWLVDEVVSHHFVDLEFRTSSNEPDTYETKRLNFFAFLPKHAQLQSQDYIELHGRFYRVVDQYADSGLQMARVDREEDTRIDFLIITQEGSRYDQELMRYVSEERTFQVTGELAVGYDFATWLSDSQDYIDLIIERDHIGFEPKTGMEVEIEGLRRTIRRVSTQAGKRQYRLRCA